jgi:type I restriction enzyme S subunit
MLFDSPPDSWQVSTLGVICQEGGGDIQTGPFGSQLHASDYVLSGIPSIMPANIKEGRVSEEGIARISEADATRLSKYLTKAGDIVYSRRGDVERCALIRKREEGWLCGTGCLRVRPGSGVVDPDFCSHFLSHPETKEWISRHAVGATMPNLNTQILSALPVLLPSLQEQKAIAHILGTLDDKIELNRKTNETLEAMAKALFKSWFVDFDPVRAKAEGRPTGLPAEISDLFPDSFEDSQLGEIPSGWRDGEIQDVADLNPENWGSRNQPIKIRYLDLASVKYGRTDNLEEYEWEDAPSRARRILKKGDTVVGTVRPGNGSYCLIGEDGITGSTGFAVLRPKARVDDAFVYLGSCSKDNIDRLAHLADGGAYPAVRPELVAQTPVVIPSRQVLDHFSSYVSPLFANAGERERESKVLCHLRDTLLPKLISGELRISDAEQLVGNI